MRNEATFFTDEYISDFFGSHALDPPKPVMLTRTVSIHSPPPTSTVHKGTVIVCLPLILGAEDLSLPATFSIFSDELPEGGLHITSKVSETLLKDRRVLAYRLDALEESADKLLAQKGLTSDPHVKHIIVANRDRTTLINYLKALVGPVVRNASAVKLSRKDDLIRILNSAGVEPAARKVIQDSKPEEAKKEEAPRRVVSTTAPPLYIGIIFSEES